MLAGTEVAGTTWNVVEGCSIHRMLAEEAVKFSGLNKVKDI